MLLVVVREVGAVVEILATFIIVSVTGTSISGLQRRKRFGDYSG
jgi:hypothetical protein